MTSYPARSRARFGFLLAVFALVLFPAFARADETPPGVLAFTVTPPADKLSTKAVHDAVMQAATGRKWNIKENNVEKVVIYLNNHGHEATVTFLISDKSVEAYCEGYKVDGKGTRKGPEQPAGWLKNLKNDITKLLNEAALASPG